MSAIRPAMADGRAFTHYTPSCVMDSQLASHFRAYGPSYRQFLQHQADKAYDESRKLSVCSISPCFILPDPVTPRPRLTDPQDPRS